ncbi:MAG TPA: methylenetetrahydrofolate reductase [Acetivibrio sp.]|uniref:methylenetetrahydrofolate reductase n=1 Tax=Acetivibrio sp. TaxID=1872092 RepID=UPI002CB8B489|nr:methylenetetrahydrofolate reductase [Acetivibrio sp.]HOM02922.1 methylenetetrahydrofolate reductase [Acetivibrio sp.]
MLKQKILNGKSGIITYGITPPKKNNTEEKIKEISQKHIERINGLDIDGLVIYDIQDEKDRISENRPFPFIETVDPQIYSENYLKDLKIPKIIYRSVGKYTPDEFRNLIRPVSGEDAFSVFVGAASRNQSVLLKLSDAYKIRQDTNPDLMLGGVAIPERHMKNFDEHLRIIDKINKGCKYFITQAVYNVEAAKDFLSDYYYYSKNSNLTMVPVIFTLTPCGSTKTLEFMKWLGISIPRWLENDLMNSEDILNKSVSLSKSIFNELMEFCLEKGIPVGCNIESVSVRKVEIEASIALAKDIKYMMKGI